METVLLIENDAATLVARSLILRCFGYTVLEADSRGAAWSVCCEHQGPIHLILTDAVLDGDSFGEFLTRLQLICPQIRTLFFCDAPPGKLADRQSMPCECSYDVLSTPNNCVQLEADQREAVASRKNSLCVCPLSLLTGTSSERPGAVK